MDLSILLVQYRPDEGELRRTLASLLRQSCRDFELVVADDGSDEDFFPLTRKILAENGFTGAKFVKLTPNGGTVKKRFERRKAGSREMGVHRLAGGLSLRRRHGGVAAGGLAPRCPAGRFWPPGLLRRPERRADPAPRRRAV